MVIACQIEAQKGEVQVTDCMEVNTEREADQDKDSLLLSGSTGFK